MTDMMGLGADPLAPETEIAAPTLEPPPLLGQQPGLMPAGPAAVPEPAIDPGTQERFAAVGSAIFGAGVGMWRFGPPDPALGRAVLPAHAWAEERAARIGRNSVLTASDPVEQARVLAGKSGISQIEPGTFPMTDPTTGQEVDQRVGPGDSDWVRSMEGEFAPEVAFLTTQPRTNAFLSAPPDVRAGLAHVANVLDGGKAPEQALGFVEGLAGRYVAELPDSHGAAASKNFEQAQIMAAGFEFARWDFAVDNLELTGSKAEGVKAAYGALRSGDELNEEQAKLLADTMVQFAQRMEPIDHPELNLEAMTAAVTGFDLDSGGVQISALAWGGKPLADLDEDEFNDRVSQVFRLHPTQMVEIMADNVENYVREYPNAWTDRSVPNDSDGPAKVALGVSVKPGPWLAEPGPARQLEQALSIAAVRLGDGFPDATPDKLRTVLGSAFADDGWMPGVGPVGVFDTRVLDAVTQPAFNHGIPVTGIKVEAPTSARQISVDDYVKQHLRNPGTVDQPRMDLIENGDKTFSLAGPVSGVIPPEQIRGVYPTGLRTDDGRQVYRNRRPAVAVNAKAQIDHLASPTKMTTDPVRPEAVGGRVFDAPPTPVAFQPGLFMRVAAPVRTADGSAGEAVMARFTKELERLGVKPAAKGTEKPHRGVSYPTEDAEGVLHWEAPEVEGQRVPHEQASTEFWFEFTTTEEMAKIETLLNTVNEEGVPYAQAKFGGERHLDRTFYVNGAGEAPKGTSAVYEHHYTDAGGGYSVNVSRSGDGASPNTVVAYVPGVGDLAPSADGGQSIRKDGDRYILSNSTLAAPAPDVAEIRATPEDVNLEDIMRVRIKRRGSNSWEAPDHAWVILGDGPAQVTYGGPGSPEVRGPGLRMKVDRVHSTVEVVTEAGMVGGFELDDAAQWLQAHGLGDYRLKERA